MWLSGQSTQTDCEGFWVLVLVGLCAFSSTVTFGGSIGSVLGLQAGKGLSSWFQHGSEQIQG